MFLFIIVYLLLYLVKYFLYEIEIKFFIWYSILLNIITVCFFTLFPYILLKIYGFKNIYSILELGLLVISVILMIKNFIFIKNKMKFYIFIIDINYFLIYLLLLFIVISGIMDTKFGLY